MAAQPRERSPNLQSLTAEPAPKKRDHMMPHEAPCQRPQAPEGQLPLQNSHESLPLTLQRVRPLVRWFRPLVRWFQMAPPNDAEFPERVHCVRLRVASKRKRRTGSRSWRQLLDCARSSGALPATDTPPPQSGGEPPHLVMNRAGTEVAVISGESTPRQCQRA